MISDLNILIFYFLFYFILFFLIFKKSGGLDPHWYAFTGNEIGILLGHWLIKKWKGKELREPSGKVRFFYSNIMLVAVD